jgi:hypothetical protein
MAACERVLEDKSTNGLSIISIIEGLNFDVPPDVEIPREAAVPYAWQFVTLWQRQPEDEGREFEQRVVFIAPDGVEVGGGLAPPFTMSKSLHRTIGKHDLLPVGQSGEYLIRVQVREVGTEDWHEAGDYPLYITHSIDEALNAIE